MDFLLKIAKQQQQSIDPDAIFGRIDPRDTSQFQLSNMFKSNRPLLKKYYDQRKEQKEQESAMRPWNDNSEFATPNLNSKTNGQNYLINIQNVKQISSFNPFDIKPVRSSTKVKH